MYAACGVLGIDPTDMSWLIKEWAERSRAFHNEACQYISDCYWGRLAEQISRDLEELLNVESDRDTETSTNRSFLASGARLRCHVSR